MTRLAVTALCLLAFSISAPAQLPKIPRDRLVEDLRIARAALEEGHSGIYRYTSKADLDRVFDDAERSIDRPMDAYEFYRILAPAVAAIKCGHTGTALPKEIQEELNTTVPMLPLQVRVIEGTPYVFRDFSSKDGALAGREIRAINGVDASRIVKTMIAASPGDGDVTTSREYRISDMRFAMNLVRLLGIRAPYEVKLRDAPGRDTSVKLDGMPVPKLVEASKARYPQDQRVDRSADLEMLDGGKIARMTVRGFFGLADPVAKKDLRQFFAESFATMKAQGTTALVLDLRNNGGGEDELGRILLSYLVDAPFTYYEDLVLNKVSFDFEKYATEKVEIPTQFVEKRADGRYHAVGHPNWGLRQPSEPGFRGKVVVLINGGSFSTTSEFLSQLHDHHRATYVGEESGGGYFGNTSGPDSTIVLPSSKVTVHIPLMTYYMAVKGSRGAAPHGIIPDFPVRPTVADLIAGRDPALDKGLALARAR